MHTAKLVQVELSEVTFLIDWQGENVSGIPLAVTRTGVQTVVDARLDYG